MAQFYLPPLNCQVPDLGLKWELIFGRRTDGFFVEVGAYDGENFSNTSCLADVGWAGVYVEPIEEFAERCKERHKGNPRIRVQNCAASETEGEATIFLGDTLTTLESAQVADYTQIDWAKGLHRGHTRTIQTRRLDSILTEQGVSAGFDLVVIDVEGAEERVVNGFDINKWHPKVILIELEDEHPDFRDNARVVSSVTKIRDTLERAGYLIYYKDAINSLYVRQDVFERIGACATLRVTDPAVSIGLPTYNRVDLLKQAVASLRDQSFCNFELVISDNCSPDSGVRDFCIALAERDPRIVFIRQSENVGALNNFLAVFERSRSPLFMWASDDDIWDSDFLARAVSALDEESIAAWMCHIKVVSFTGEQIRKTLPNLARFTSDDRQLRALTRFIFDPECLGKANLFYAVYRRAQLSRAIEAAKSHLSLWGADMLLIYAFMCRARTRVVPDVHFSKRAAPGEEAHDPVIPREFIVPWDEAANFYCALIDVSRRSPYFMFTWLCVCARYIYDMVYWRLNLKKRAPVAHFLSIIRAPFDVWRSASSKAK